MMQFKDPRILWQTDVGSWMWRMNRPDSDHDYYIAYVFDARSFLVGNSHEHAHQSHGETEDVTKYEIGVIVKQLVKGNVNHLWGLLSPMVEITSPEHATLRALINDHPSKCCYNSLKGMTLHNLHDYFDSVTSKQRVQTMMREDARLYWKKLNTICRGLEFGIRVFEGKGYQFLPTNYTERADIDWLLKDFEVAYANSTIPDHPDESIIEKFLLDIRLRDLALIDQNVPNC